MPPPAFVAMARYSYAYDHSSLNSDYSPACPILRHVSDTTRRFNKLQNSVTSVTTKYRIKIREKQTGCVYAIKVTKFSNMATECDISQFNYWLYKSV